MVVQRPLGRRVPSDFDHVAKYPFATVAPPTVQTVERVLKLPGWHWSHDQGHEGSCVGHGVAMERAITNIRQNVLARILLPDRRYDPIQLWNAAKVVDGFPDTNPGDNNGTTVRAAYDVARNAGLARVSNMVLTNGVPTPVGEKPVDPTEGVSATRWAVTVDEVRTAINSGIPSAIGVNWYTNFDQPVTIGTDTWIGKTALGQVRGGHCVTIFGASDKRQAVRIKNSWGRSYPLVWMPYTTLQTLISQQGEVALITDR